MKMIVIILIFSSTNVLKSVKVTNDSSLLDIVDDMEQSLLKGSRSEFIKIVKEGWDLKKKTSNRILSNESLKLLDQTFSEDDKILCHKLCGAGNGGFFLLFYKKGHTPSTNLSYLKVDVDYNGSTIIY